MPSLEQSGPASPRQNTGDNTPSADNREVGRVHVGVALVSGIATIALPFTLALRMRRADGWHDLAQPTVLAGSLLVAILAVYVAFEGRTGGGYLQRAAILVFSAGVVALAVRVRALARPAGRPSRSTPWSEGDARPRSGAHRRRQTGTGSTRRWRWSLRCRRAVETDGSALCAPPA